MAPELQMVIKDLRLNEALRAPLTPVPEGLVIPLEPLGLPREQNELLTFGELERARQVQQSQIPRKFPRLPGFGLAGFSLSARQLAGDFFDAVPAAGEKVLLVVADVMGKGVPAALFAATLRTFFRTMVEVTAEPAALLTRLNRLLYED